MTGVPVLRDEPTPVVRKRPPIRACIYAEKGVGKTALALTASRPLVVDTNFGLEGEAVPEDLDALQWTPDEYPDLASLYFAMKSNDRDRDTWVIDQVDSLNAWLIRQSVMTWASKSRKPGAGMVNIGQGVAEQRDYLAAATALHDFLLLLARSGKDIILLAHTLQPDPQKGEYKRGPAMNAASRKEVEDWANIYGEYQIVRVEGKPEQRVLSWLPDDPTRRTANRWRSVLKSSMVNPTIPNIKKAISRAYTKPTQPAATARKADQ